MTEPIFLVVDTETGGLDANRDSLLSVSFVAWSRDQVGPMLDLFVCEPDLITTIESMEINRIDLKRLRVEGIAPRDAVDKIGQFLRASFPSGKRVTLAGHNVGFDIAFLKRLYRMAECDYSAIFSHRSFDTASVLRFLRLSGLAELPDESSDSAFSYFRVRPPTTSRHTAAGDALATALLISRMIEFAESLVPIGDAITEERQLRARGY